MSLSPIFSTFRERPASQGERTSKTVFQSTIRDNFTWPTWLLIGAFVHGSVSILLPYHNILLFALVAIVVFWQVGRTILISYGLLRNHRMEGVIPGRTTIVYPSEKTGQQGKPGEKMICAIVLAMRCNHPLGLFGPGSKEVGDFFNGMCAELDKNATELGFLGCSKWTAAGDRGYASETMGIFYFESAEKVHEYAHGPLHTRATEWWMKTAKSLPHIGLMHEIIEAPKGHWEGIYLNYHPTGLGATSKETEVNGQKVWVNPLVKANGPLLTSKYRMTGMRGSEKEWPAFEEAMRVSGENMYAKA